MLRLPNVMTPDDGPFFKVPDNTPVPGGGFVPIATVTLSVDAGVVFPSESCTVTCTEGVIGEPAVTCDGWVVNASRLGGAGVMLNAALVPFSAPLEAVSVYPVPVRSSLRLLKEATPAAAARLVVAEGVNAPLLG